MSPPSSTQSHESHHPLTQTQQSTHAQISDCAIVRYYLRPEDTHVGRQRHHGARELFLARKTMYEPVAALLRRAWVKSPRAVSKRAGLYCIFF